MRYSLFITLLVLGNQIAAQYESEVLFETDSSVYLLLTEPTSWLVAESRAQELGGWLVTLHTEDENTAVFEAFQASESTEIEEGYFMGLRQDESLPGFYEPQGGWVWGASQGAVLWSNWDINEPNQGGNTGVESCGSVKGLNSGLGVWNDVSCSNNINKAVVEVPVFVVGCTAPPACNYDPSATFEDGSCEYASCHCLEGTVWNEELGGCIVANPSDSDFDGCVGMTDLLDLLSVFGTCNEIPWSCGDPLEYQGYDYETVQIGDQCWFAENLRAENYRNGEQIASQDYSTSALEFGVLYRGVVLMADHNICPASWSVASDSDWLELELFLGAESSEVQLFEYSDERLLGFGNELKPSSSNQLGFNAAFGGYLNGPDATQATDLGVNGQWWTSTFSEDDGNLAIYRNLESWTSGISRMYQPISSYGFSVRCIQDAE